MTTNANDYLFGYCTNVHAGITLLDAQANLERVAMRVRQLVAPHGRLPVGLWLAERAARQLAQSDGVARFGDWLADRGLKAYTFNGFPQGDFHQAVVKHAVYEPNWLDTARVEYTCLLGDILAGLLPEGQGGSISTVPLGWPHRPWQADQFAQAATHLRTVATHFSSLAQRTGREIVLAIEPEPGCVLNRAQEVIDFLQQFVFDGHSESVRRHITVCHDICHSAVMFESQGDALQAYADNEIRIGKLQVSSAVEVPWQEVAGDESGGRAMAGQLLGFDEPRYLHQTTRVGPGDGRVELVEDLPIALRNWCSSSDAAYPDQPWRIHFHVPIYAECFGLLKATREDIAIATQCVHARRELQVAGRPWFTGDFEVETYAWGVLPPDLQVGDLAQGIARELEYFQGVLIGDR